MLSNSHSTPRPNSYLSDVDVLLMLEVKKGDNASFETLMHKYYKRILNFIYRLVGNSQAAEDLTQEVFFKVYQASRTYEPTASFRTWIYTIAKNTSLNEIRKNKHQPFSLDAMINVKDDAIHRQVEDKSAVNPLRNMQVEETKMAIKKAVLSLPDNQRLALILRRYENFSYDEIAEHLNTTVSAVKSLLNRAKEGLRTKLSGLVGDV
jgi:RNA polymerase sigma-70 factor, ECF subfamily